jgi:hypothetical protein
MPIYWCLALVGPGATTAIRRNSRLERFLERFSVTLVVRGTGIVGAQLLER